MHNFSHRPRVKSRSIPPVLDDSLEPRFVPEHSNRGFVRGDYRKIEMVGTPRFELGTSPTPRVRATRLRYVPTGEKMGEKSVSLVFEEGQGSPQLVAKLDECGFVHQRRFGFPNHSRRAHAGRQSLRLMKSRA